MRKLILLAVIGFAWRQFVKRNPQAASGTLGRVMGRFAR